MGKLWLIHRHNNTLGPWSAAEVRAELRKGTIDPFDLVSSEGSQEKRELVGVDEIFQYENPIDDRYSDDSDSVTNKSKYQSSPKIPPAPSKNKVDFLVDRRHSPDPSSRAPGVCIGGGDTPASGQTQDSQALNSEKPKVDGVYLVLAQPDINRRTNVGGKSSAKGKGATGVASELSGIFSKLAGRRGTGGRRKEDRNLGNLSYEAAKKDLAQAAQQLKNPQKSNRQYFLADSKGRIFGPKNAGEIKTLFYRGLLGDGVSVKKDRSQVAVPVEKFVRIYSSTRQGATQPSVVGASPRTNPSKKIGRHRPADYLSGYAVTGMRMLQSSRRMMIASIGVLIIALAIGAFTLKKTRSMSRSSMSRSSMSSRPSLRKPPRSNQPNRNTRPKKQTKLASNSGKHKSFDDKESQNSRKPIGLKSKNRQPSLGGSLARPGGRNAKRYRYSKGARHAEKNSIKSRKMSAVAAAVSRIGQVVSIGPLRFRPNALNACALKCKISMWDATGRSLQVIFFKAAFNNRLAGKSAKVFVTGRISNDGNSLFLNGIK